MREYIKSQKKHKNRKKTHKERDRSREERKMDRYRDKVSKDVLWLSFKGIINEFEMDVFQHIHIHTLTQSLRLIEVIILARFIFERWVRALRSKCLFHLAAMLLLYWRRSVCIRKRSFCVVERKIFHYASIK